MDHDRLPRLMRAFEDVSPLRTFLLWTVTVLSIPTLYLATTHAARTPVLRLLLVLHGGALVALLSATLRQWWLRRTIQGMLHLR